MPNGSFFTRPTDAEFLWFFRQSPDIRQQLESGKLVVVPPEKVDGSICCCECHRPCVRVKSIPKEPRS